MYYNYYFHYSYEFVFVFLIGMLDKEVRYRQWFFIVFINKCAVNADGPIVFL